MKAEKIPVYMRVGTEGPVIEIGNIVLEKSILWEQESDLLIAKFLSDTAKNIVQDMDPPHCSRCFKPLHDLAHDSCRSVE